MQPAPPVPLTRDLVLIGGGHAHALVLRRWGMRPLPGARLTVINPDPTAPYTGMLPGHVAGHYPREALEIDLVRLCRFAGARLILGWAEAIDLSNKRISIGGRGEIAYDIASIDVGITSDLPDLPGFKEHAVPAKPLGGFATAWRSFLDSETPAKVAVIGAGVGGVELALAMHHALISDAGRGVEPKPEITLIDAGRTLTGLGETARNALRAELSQRGISLIEEARVAHISAESVTLEDGRTVPSNFTVGAAGARPLPWLSTTGLAQTDGFLDVDDTLRTSDPAVYAAGDCAHLTFAPRPKAGVFAVRAAPILAANLRADLAGGARRHFRPQRDYIKLISLGGRSAVGEKWGVTLKGPRLWQVKDRIDRAFMEKLNTLPPMAAPTLPGEVAQGVRAEIGQNQPLCAGCGSKVGQAPLSRALSRLPPGADRTDVEVPAGDDAAVLKLGETRLAISTDHLRAFTEDPHIFARIAACHALNDVWAMGGQPQAALATVILPRMTGTLQERWLEEIMAGAAAAFAEAGATIAGGHTTLGAELTLGFTVTGVLPATPITLSGAQPGDALILTRPLGSGLLLAAEMQLRARGADIAALLNEMAAPQGRVAACLAPVHALTDVTGFGLAGHLLNMLEASDVGADIKLDALPAYQGALEVAEAGIRSTLAPANEAALVGRITTSNTARAALLFDPQTAGGFLAAIAESDLDRALQELHEAGASPARIGTVTKGPAEIRLR